MLYESAPSRRQTAPSLPIAFTLLTARSEVQPSRADFVTWVRTVSARTREVFSQCGVEVDVVQAQLAATDASWLRVRAATPASHGGVVPDGGDAEAFYLQAGERLTPEVTRLFSFARRELPPEVVTVVVVERIDYFVSQQPTRAAGLSFPAIAYRHPDDWPARNGVLVAAPYGRPGAVPGLPGPRLVAHELAHTVLNAPGHHAESDNLLSVLAGEKLTLEQCLALVAVLHR